MKAYAVLWNVNYIEISPPCPLRLERGVVYGRPSVRPSGQGWVLRAWSRLLRDLIFWIFYTLEYFIRNPAVLRNCLAPYNRTTSSNALLDRQFLWRSLSGTSLSNCFTLFTLYFTHSLLYFTPLGLGLIIYIPIIILTNVTLWQLYVQRAWCFVNKIIIVYYKISAWTWYCVVCTFYKSMESSRNMTSVW